MTADGGEESRRYAGEEEYIAKQLEEPAAFCNAFWGNGDAGYETINARMKTASRTVEEVRAIYKERAEIEADYAKRLGKLAKTIVGKDETGSTRQALEVVRGELDMTSRVHNDLSVMIRKDLEGAIAEFQAKLQGTKKNAAASIERLFKNKQAQENYVNKSRERYEQDCIKINGYTAQSSLVQGRDLDKVTSKLDKAQSTVQANDKDYQNFVRALKDTTARWNTEWKAYLDQCQDMEEERLDFIKSNLWNYANAISAVCVADDEGCERIRVALENCETPKDIAIFIQQRGTGPVIPDPPEYINYARGQHGPARTPCQMANFVRQTTRPVQPPPPSQPQFGSGVARRDGGGEGSASKSEAYQPIRANGTPAAEVLPPAKSQYKPVAPPPGGGIGLPGMVLPEQTGPSYQPQQHPPVATPPKAERRMSAKNFLARAPSLVNKTNVNAGGSGSANSYNSYPASVSNSQQSATTPTPDEDPIAKALASLRMKSGGKSPAPSQHQKPPSSIGVPASSVASSDRRYSQVSQGRAPSPGPSMNGASRHSPSPSAAFMQAPQRSHSPLPVEDVVSSYGQAFPGERKSLSRQGSFASANSSTRVNVNSSQPPQRGRSPAPSMEGFAGIGARGRSPSPQPYSESFVHHATPSYDGRAHQHQGGHGSISAPHQSQRAGTPLGISLDASGSVTHDQMAQEYMQRTSSLPTTQQQQQQQPAPPPASYQQLASSSQYHPYQPQQGGQAGAGGYGAPPSHQRPSSVVYGQQQQTAGAPSAGQGRNPPVVQAAPAGASSSYTASSIQNQQGQQGHSHYSHQQQPAAPPVQYNQAAPQFHHQEAGGSTGYSNYGQQQGALLSQSHGPGNGSPVAPSTGSETAASAYMHQYQRQSNLASSALGQYDQPAGSHGHMQQPQRWSQQGSTGQAPAAPNGGYSAPPSHQQVVPVIPQQQQHHHQQQQQQQQRPQPPPPVQQPQQAAPVAPTGQYSDTGKPILFYVKAMYDYTATTEEEFSFTLGDIIAVTQTDPDGWWQGELLDEARRKLGANTFPSNFTNLLT